MSTVQSLLLDDIRATLIERIRCGLNQGALERALAVWLVSGNLFDVDTGTLIDDLMASNRTPRETAALGILAQSKTLDDATMVALRNDLRQLLGREPIVAGTPMPFCMDSLTLGGILLGVSVVQQSDLRDAARGWISACRQATSDGRGLGEWQEGFLGLVAAHTDLPWSSSDDDYAAPIVTVAVQSVGIHSSDDIDAIEKEERTALSTIKAGVPQDIEFAEALFRLSCIDWIRRSRPIADLRDVSISELCELLRRTPSAMQYWTWEDKPRTKNSEARQWHVDHEYHVQNLLWAILSPVFPDLVPEDYTAKIHTKHPRADLCIPSLRLVIEAKFWYSHHASKKIIEEIAEDASLYLVPESRYRRIVPFIWDDGRRTEEHDGLITALRKFDGIEDAVVISRPGTMAKP